MDQRISDWEQAFRADIERLGFYDANCWYGMSNQPRRALIPTLLELDRVVQKIGYRKCNVCTLVAKYLKPVHGNSLLLEELRNTELDNKEFYTPAIVLTPWMFAAESEFEEYLGRMLESGVKSVRMFPKTHNYLMNTWSYEYVPRLLEAYRVPLFVWTKDFDWNQIYDLCDRHPRLPVIVEQCDVEAFFNLGYIVPLLEACTNVYLETNRVHEYAALDFLVKKFGGGRFIYGSHMPLDDPYAQLAVITMGQFSDDDKRQIAHENLERLFAGIRT